MKVWSQGWVLDDVPSAVLPDSLVSFRLAGTIIYCSLLLSMLSEMQREIKNGVSAREVYQRAMDVV